MRPRPSRLKVALLIRMRSSFINSQLQLEADAREVLPYVSPFLRLKRRAKVTASNMTMLTTAAI